MPNCVYEHVIDRRQTVYFIIWRILRIHSENINEHVQTKNIRISQYYQCGTYLSNVFEVVRNSIKWSR